MKLLLCGFLFALCAQNFAVKPPINPLYTVDKTTQRRPLNSFDTCGLKLAECDPDTPYRTYDGSCNNLDHPTWGVLNSALVRIFEPRYSDGIELPPVAVDGSELPNARKIVTTLFTDKDVPDKFSLIVAQWAQFFAHDIGANVNKQGVADCCASDDVLTCLPVSVPDDDPFFAQYNKTCISLTRSEKVVCGDCDPNGPKVPINGVSHAMDCSQVYGSDPEVAKTLRAGQGGFFLVRLSPDGKQFLPSSGSCYKSDVCYIAGESRVNQNTQLTVLHTMLVRGHNLVAGGLAALQPTWDDDKIFEETRRIIIAAYQHITWYEFLSIILPDNDLVNTPVAYDPEIPPSVLVSFNNPTFRLFHSGLQGVIGLYDYHLNPTKHINLTDYMNSPGIIEEGDNFDELILGVITQPMQTLDDHYTAEIEEKLFHFGNPYGTDLNSIDIQRSRDHGSPSYVTVVYGCEGVEIKDFDDLLDIWPAEKVEQVKQIYTSVEDIDLFIGLNFENKKEGHKFCPSAECLIAEQFYRWRNGDRFWYELTDQAGAFTPEQLAAIKKVTLSRLICISASNIVNVTVNAWLPPSDDNPVVSCDDIPAIDITPWA